jgi:hypothetical protein
MEVLEVRTASINCVIEAVRTSETSVYFNETTQRYNPGSCYSQIRRRENLKYHNS